MRQPRLWVVVAVIALLLVADSLIGGAGSPISAPGSPGGSLSGTTSGVEGPPSGPTLAAASPGTSAEATVLPSPGTNEPLATLLAMLRIAAEDRTGYSRSLFVHWIDADGNGCDTRREVLIAEAVVRPTIGPHCSLAGGRWFSPYDGLTVSDAAALQIDHVVPLAEAWDSGASAWTANRRMRYANDLDAPFVLIAVSASSNEAKSDDDPADWLPPSRAARCPYLGAWLATKVRWDLAVDPREHDALVADIRDCTATTMPYLPAGPAGETSGLPTPGPGAGSGGSAGACDPAYPTVCIPPPPPDLDCGDITYRDFQVLPPDPHHFDGDHDGIGCES